VRETPEGTRTGRSGGGRVALFALGGLALLAGGVGIGWLSLGGAPEPSPPIPPPLPGPFVPPPTDVPSSPSPGGCPELASYDSALTSLPIPELEGRLRTSGVMMPSTVDQSLAGMRAQLGTYPAERRECMYKMMLVAQVSSLSSIARSIPGGWAHGRTSADLANLFRSVPLREPWTLSERDEVLALVEQNVITSLRADGEGDREYWRHMYYGLLLQCEATDEALRTLEAPREANNCLRFRPANGGSQNGLRPVP
jgi:hypothetical protein